MLLNKGVFIGHSSRPIYDKCYLSDRLSESVAPLQYKLNPTQYQNCNACLSVFGPRGGKGPNSYGVSTTVGNTNAPAQQLADVESILSNRNVLLSKCKDGKVNDVDVTKFTLQHARICNDFLDPVSSRLTNPPQNYRGMSINRFHDLPKNPQANIFYDFAINSKLEAKDNYKERVPRLMHSDPALPSEIKGRNLPARYVIPNQCGMM